MDATCIVAANAGRARFFLRIGRSGRPDEINDMVNAASRLRATELETDNLGRRSASKSKHNVGQPTPPSGYQPHQTPQEHENELFARSVADYLVQLHREGRFTRLVLVASPEFLGVLRKLLDPQLQALIEQEINKDYTQLRPDELMTQLDRQAERT
jgi:protein required for attachment to host cells